MFKGQLISNLKPFQLIDISNDIDKFNTHQAAYIIKKSFSFFPKKSVHICAISKNIEANEGLIVAQYQDHYFIAPNNGILNLTFEKAPEKLTLFDYKLNELLSSQILDIIQNALNDTFIESNQKEVDFEIPPFPVPHINNGGHLIGTIFFIDSYGNAITNLKKEDIERFCDYNNAIVHFKGFRVRLAHKTNSNGDAYCYFNHENMLVIALKFGQASVMLALMAFEQIYIENYKK